MKLVHELIPYHIPRWEVVEALKENNDVSNAIISLCTDEESKFMMEEEAKLPKYP